MRVTRRSLLVIPLVFGACAGSGERQQAPFEASATAGGGNGGTTTTAAGSGAGGSSDGGSAIAGQSQGGESQGGESQAGNGNASNAGFALPPANAGFDYQIGGAYTPPQGVKVVSRDRGDAPAPGLYNICYVNGFQAQPAEDDWWKSEHSDLILRDAAGAPVIDPDWDEMLLDTSTAEKRQALAQIVGGWIHGCKTAGFDAIEIDNLDSYSRSNGKLSRADNVALMKLLSDIGHQAGLAMGQKNSTELVGDAQAMGTDFAVVEECNRYSECGDYKTGYGDLVFVIEYRDQDFAAGCKNYPELSIVRRDREVSTPGSAGYVFDGC